jgi:hypothetical protein
LTSSALRASRLKRDEQIRSVICVISTSDPNHNVKEAVMNKAQGERAETTGAINDFVREIVRYYPNLSEELVRVVVVHPGNFLLPELGKEFCLRQRMPEPAHPALAFSAETGWIHHVSSNRSRTAK